MKAGSAAASAMTSTSLGPAGMSMATIASLFWSSILAAVTYWLPGPSILCTCDSQRRNAQLERHTKKACLHGATRRNITSAKTDCPLEGVQKLQAAGMCAEHRPRTLGHVSVPHAIAATAWAPPAARTCVTPALRAQYSTSCSRTCHSGHMERV